MIKGKTLAYANEVHTQNYNYPQGVEAILSSDPNWVYDSEDERWDRDCILQVMKAPQKKPVNYYKLAAIVQGTQVNPTSFTERLREALIIYTTSDHDDPGRAITLKDKFSLIYYEETTEFRKETNYPHRRDVKSSILSIFQQEN